MKCEEVQIEDTATEGKPMSGENRVETETNGELWRLVSRSVEGESLSVPTRALLAPWGQVESANGEFIVDEESGRLVAEAFAAQGTDLPIDYEHQTLGGEFASPSGQAPAAGWIKSLEVVPNEGLVATVEWTEAAAGKLAAKEYRYLSPVALVRKGDRRLVGLHSAALTNKPAIVGMQPIVNRATEAAPGAEAVEALRCRLELEGEAELDELLSVACRRIDELSARLRGRDAEELVLRAMRQGKLTEAQKEWATKLARDLPETFAEWVRTAPAVVPMGATSAPSVSSGRSAGRIERMAREEYRSHKELGALTDEESYVADAVRSAG